MCEMIACRAKHPFRLGRVLAWAEDLERWGDAGYGWGVAWREPESNQLRLYRRPCALAEDNAAYRNVGDRWATEVIVHLRVPSDFRTIGTPDTQPFLHPDGIAYAHNGYFPNHAEVRRQLEKEDAARGLLRGQADSEVAMWVAWAGLQDGLSLPEALKKSHDLMGGMRANVVAMLPGGEMAIYGANVSNPFWRLRHMDMDVAVTGMHRDNVKMVRALFPGAGKVHKLEVGTGVTWKPEDFRALEGGVRGVRKPSIARAAKAKGGVQASPPSGELSKEDREAWSRWQAGANERVRIASAL